MPVVCNASDPLDACDWPEYCISNTLACNLEPNRHAPSQPEPHAASAARALTLGSSPTLGCVRSTRMNFASPCPSLLNTGSVFAQSGTRYSANHRCWEQADGSGPHSERERLSHLSASEPGTREMAHYSANDRELTVTLPDGLNASCHGRPVEPLRFQYYGPRALTWRLLASFGEDATDATMVVCDAQVLLLRVPHPR